MPSPTDDASVATRTWRSSATTAATRRSNSRRSGPMGRRSRPRSSSASSSRTALTGQWCWTSVRASAPCTSRCSRPEPVGRSTSTHRATISPRPARRPGDEPRRPRRVPLRRRRRARSGAATGRSRDPRLRHLLLPVSAGHARGGGQIQAEAGRADLSTRRVVDANLHAGVQRNTRAGSEPCAVLHPPSADRTEVARRGGVRRDPRRRNAGVAGLGISANLNLCWTRASLRVGSRACRERVGHVDAASS